MAFWLRSNMKDSGLWPDKWVTVAGLLGYGIWIYRSCDGTYIEDCDPSRDYKNIAGVSWSLRYQDTPADFPQLLESQGASSTLEFMQQYWLNDHGSNERFWEVRETRNSRFIQTLIVEHNSTNGLHTAHAIGTGSCLCGILIHIHFNLFLAHWMLTAFPATVLRVPR